MTRIGWLLKGDPLYSLQAARSSAIAVPRGSYITRERSGPDYEALNKLLESDFGIMDAVYPRIDPADYRYLGQRAVMP